MLQLFISVLLIAHGLVHLAVWLPRSSTQPADVAAFDPHHSWLLPREAPDVSGDRAAVACCVLYVLAGVAVWLSPEVAAVAIVVAAASGLALKLVYFSRWLLVGVALDLAVLLLGLALWYAAYR